MTDQPPTDPIMPPEAGRVARLARRRIGPLERLTIWRAIRMIIVFVATLIFTVATIERFVEPQTFNTYGRSLWWAVVTIATVGYGDIVPVTPAGRTVASFAIIFAMAVVPTVTSLIVAALVTKSQMRQNAAFAAQITTVSEQLARVEDHLAKQAGELKGEAG